MARTASSHDADFNLFVSEDEAALFQSQLDRPASKNKASKFSQQDRLARSNLQVEPTAADSDVEMSEMAEPSSQSSNVNKDPPSSQKSSSEKRKVTLDDLYVSLGIDQDASSMFAPKYRMETIHVRGVDALNSAQVLDFFEGLNPLKVEWVNDTSCNVLFENDMSAAKALMAKSQPLLILKKPAEEMEIDLAKFEVDEDTGEEVMVSDVASFALPVPQGRWRVAINAPPKTKQLIFRLARSTDKKAPNAQKFSQFYAKQGLPSGSFTVTATAKPIATTKTIPASQRIKPAVRKQEDHIVTPPKVNSRTVYVGQTDSFFGRMGPALAIRVGALSSPYSRPTSGVKGKLDQRASRVEAAVQRSTVAPARNDLRNLLQRRENIPTNDLRHRLSQSAGSSGGPDLRNRLNSLRRDS